MEIVRPWQFAAFAKNLDTGVPSDADGRPFADATLATCMIFDSLDEAQTFCEGAVTRTPAVRFEIFDGAGRANPPLMTVVDASRRGTVDADASVLRRRRIIAWAMIVCAIPTLVFAYFLRDGGHQIFGGFVGLNLLVAAGRLLWFNLAVRETERVRRDRIAAATGGTKRAS